MPAEQASIESSTALPELVEPGPEYRDIRAWIADHKDGRLLEMLNGTGGVLFRGFPVHDEAAFQQVVESVSRERLAYLYRSTPRHEVGDRIYTTTEYPAQYEIPLHNENAYQRDWPMRLMFCCIQPAEERGETPLASTAAITERIDRSVREEFARRKIMYVRNYGSGADLPWDTVFQTQDRSEVERYCSGHDIHLEWRPQNRLRTWQVCQAVARHPFTGQELWFNQAHLFHLSSLDQKTRAAMLRLMKEEDVPRNAYYGDGGALEEDVLQHIRAAYEAEKISFPWQAGDVLLLDNMLLCHGRAPYRGPRKVLAAFADMFSATAATAA